nr:double zinc ribbon [uncultured bacterium]
MKSLIEAKSKSLLCPRCRLPLRGHESLCPACGKRVFFPEWLLAVFLIAIALLVGVGVFAAGYIKAAADRSGVRPMDAYTATKQFVLRHPAVKAPAEFAPFQDTVLEPWGPRRWRITGRAATRDKSGSAIQVMYTCIVGRESENWVLEDITVELLK